MHRFYRFRSAAARHTHRFYRVAPFLSTTCNRKVTVISGPPVLRDVTRRGELVPYGSAPVAEEAAEEAATVPFRIYLTEEEAAAAE